jgi:pimeloyl-ACP methyl ester carboxylesterase
MLPTIVLVHGAFAESASWDGVIDPLLAAGHQVIAAPNPFRGPATDAPVSRSDGTTDLFIVVDRFHELFCPDVPASQATRLAATQRPATQEALVEPSGDSPLWKQVPSWFLVGENDRIIPPAVQHYMADRAGASRTVELPGASHAAPVSQPDATARLTLKAAALPVAA